MKIQYTRKQIQKAIKYWNKILNESIEFKESEKMKIPENEWDIVYNYIQKRIDLKNLSKKYKGDYDKQKHVYLILKTLGFNDAIKRFFKDSYGLIKKFEETLSNIEVIIPDKYKKLVPGYSISGNNPKVLNNNNFKKYEKEFYVTGPLDILDDLEIEYFVLDSEGIGKDRQKASECLAKHNLSIPNYTNHGINIGYREKTFIVILKNGQILHKKDRWFGYTIFYHKNFDTIAGYNVFILDDSYAQVFNKQCQSVDSCSYWIYQYVIKDK